MSLKRVRELFEEASSHRALRESIPDWLDALGAEELGEKWDHEIKALNKEADVAIRVNTLKTDKEELKFQLAENGIETLEDATHPDALILKKRSNIFRNGYFLNGHFEVQDKGSQEIAMYLQVEPGMRVIDACAGAGGKTLHLAALMQNKGRIISMDVEARKLDELRKRASRAGAHIIETRVIESSKTIKRLESSADRVLLDVPCSGLGTLRRNPDAKWKLSPEFIVKIKQTQQEIIRSYSRMVKPGGLMVYATCSVLPSEDENQVSAFLSFNPNFSLQHQQYVMPSQSNSDGFYMALLRRDA
jgi:16S rRNA (cytosine967-C5)-methyltransferase